MRRYTPKPFALVRCHKDINIHALIAEANSQEEITQKHFAKSLTSESFDEVIYDRDLRTDVKSIRVIVPSGTPIYVVYEFERNPK